MAQSKRWRKAMIVSLVFHALVLTSVGLVASRLLEPTTPPEQVIELDLSQEDDLPQEQRQTVDPVTGKIMESTSQSAAATGSSAAASANAPHIVVSSSGLTVLSVETADGGMASIGGGSSGPSGGGGDATASNGASDDGSRKSDGLGQKKHDYTRPEIVYQPAPVYPESLKGQGVEGTVKVKYKVLSNGRTDSIVVTHSSGNESLDNAVVEAVEQWIYTPSFDQSTGQAVTVGGSFSYVFSRQ